MKTINLSKQNQKILGFVLLLIPFFKPNIVDNVEALAIVDSILAVWKLVSAFLIAVLFLRKRRVYIFAFSVGAVFLFSFGSTVVHGGFIHYACVLFVSIVPLIFLLEIAKEDHEIEEVLEAVQILLEILLYANFLSILLFPNGMYRTIIKSDSLESVGKLLRSTSYIRSTENWILGLDNAQTEWCILGIIVAVLRDYSKKGELRLSPRGFILFAVCVLTPIARRVGTATVAIALIVLGFLLSKLICKHKGYVVFNIGVYVAAIVALFFLIVVFRQQKVFSFLIENILHKSLTLSGRALVWDLTMHEISMKPLFGWGIQTPQWYFDHIGIDHAHNVILQQLHTGGPLQLILYLVPHGLCVKKLWQQRRTALGCFFSIVLFAILLVDLVEVRDNTIYYCALFFLYSVDMVPERTADQQELPAIH